MLKWMVVNAPKPQYLALTVAFGLAVMLQGPASAGTLKIDSTPAAMTMEELEVVKLTKKHILNADGTHKYEQVRIQEAVKVADNKEYIFKDKRSSNARFMNLVDQGEMSADVRRLKEMAEYKKETK